jgi:hypothetical protein
MPDSTSPAPGSADKAVQALKQACDDAYTNYPNSFVDYWTTSPDWKAVSPDDGLQLANKGIVVGGGLKKSGGHGHVIVIYPGDKKASGGYSYTYKDKKTGKPLTDTLRSHGNYPRALSTSIGTWPGAMSKGDKTVWDPWASDDVFADVKFWTRK